MKKYNDIEKFLSKHSSKLENREWCYGTRDANQVDRNEWDSSDLKVLVCFLSPGSTRDVAMTFSAINNVIVTDVLNSFVDFSYFPIRKDMQILKKYNIPLWFGNLSHKPMKDYDLILISTALVAERFNIPIGLEYSGIPIGHYERMEDKDIPLIVFGGMSANFGESAYGEFEYNGRKDESFIDITYLGEAEQRLPLVLRKFKEIRDKGGSKKQIIKALVTSFDNIYYPPGYKFNYKKDTILSIDKKYNWLPDVMIPYFPHEVTGTQYERNLINLNGSKVEEADLLLSYGCSGYSSCNFKVAEGTRVITDSGAVRIEDSLNYKGEIQSTSIDQVANVYEQESSKLIQYKFGDGSVLNADKNHRMLRWKENTSQLEEVFGHQLRSGDIVLKKLGADLFGESELTEDLAMLTGFIHGDGSIKGRNDPKYIEGTKTKTDQLWVFLKGKEVDVFKPILDNLFPEFKRSKLREFYTCKDGTTIKEYRITWNMDDFRYLNWYCRSHEVRVPDIIFQSSKKVIRAYLKGIFQADGWFSRKQIGLTSVSHKFILDIQQLLYMVGIYSKVGFNGFWEKNRQVDEYCRRRSYFIYVYLYFVNKFLEDIGFVDKDKGKIKISETARTQGNCLRSQELTEFIRERYPRRSDLEQVVGNGVLHRLADYASGRFSYNQLINFKQKTGFSLPGIYDLIAEKRFIPVKFEEMVETDKVVKMFDVETKNTHWCVYDMVLTHNCAEGWLAGSWREVEFEELKEMIKKVRIWSAGDAIAFFSYNVNYYSRFKDLLHYIAGKFKHVRMRTMRADEIGESRDIYEITKMLGIIRTSLAIEGLGDRIRNKVYNKNLSAKQIYSACETAFRERFVGIKFPMVYYGQETKEDAEEGIEECKKIMELRSKLGANTTIRFSHTPLVIYDCTPMRSFERVTARLAYTGEKRADYYLEKMEEFLGTCATFHGKGYGTFVEQCFLDLGRRMTNDIVIANFKYNKIWYYGWSVRSNKHWVENYLAKHDLDTMFAKRTDDWIYPNHLVKIEMYGAMLKSEQNVKEEKAEVMCLKTVTNQKPKCAAKAFKGKSVEGYEGCTFCKSKEERATKLNRKLGSSYTVNDIREAIASNRPKHAIRMNVILKKDFSYISKIAVLRMAWSRILQADNDLEEIWHSITPESSGYWAELNNVKSWSYGTLLFDVLLKKPVEKSHLDKLIVMANKSLETIIIKDFFELCFPVQDKISDRDFINYSFHVNFPMADFLNKLAQWDHTIKKSIKIRRGIELEVVKDGTLTPPLIFPALDGGVIGAFNLKARRNPFCYFSEVLGISYWKALEIAEVRSNLVYFEGNSICKNCGKELQIVNRFNNSDVPLCGSCFLKKAALAIRNLRGR